VPTRPPVHRAPHYQPREQQQREFNAWRGSAAERGYDWAWTKLARRVKAEEPLCRFCLAADRLTPTEMIDHIAPVRDAPELRLVRSNLRGLCNPCHMARHARDGY